MARKTIGEIFLSKGIIIESQLQQALSYQKEHGCKIGEALVRLGFVTIDDLYMALAEQFNYPYINLAEYSIDQKIIDMVPSDVAYKYEVVPIGYEDEQNRVSLAIAPPFDFPIVSELQSLLGKNIKIALSSPNQIGEALDEYYKKSS